MEEMPWICAGTSLPEFGGNLEGGGDWSFSFKRWTKAASFEAYIALVYAGGIRDLGSSDLGEALRNFGAEMQG